MSRRKTIAFGLALALAAVAGWAVAATTSSASDRFAATALVETRPFSLVATLPIAGPGNGGNVNALSLDWRNVGDEHVAGKLAVGDRNYNIPMVQIFRTSLDGAQFWTESVPDKYTPSDVVDLSWRPNGNTLQLLATISSPGTSDRSRGKAGRVAMKPARIRLDAGDNLIQIIDERGFPKKLSGDGYRSAIWSPDGGRVAICRSGQRWTRGPGRVAAAATTWIVRGALGRVASTPRLRRGSSAGVGWVASMPRPRRGSSAGR